jgi:hypothetical protein
MLDCTSFRWLEPWAIHDESGTPFEKWSKICEEMATPNDPRDGRLPASRLRTESSNRKDEALRER